MKETDCKRTLLFVDRISDGIAVLISDDPEAEIVVSADLLPDGLSEGEWLGVIFERSDETWQTRRKFREEIDDIMTDLGDDP